MIRGLQVSTSPISCSCGAHGRHLPTFFWVAAQAPLGAATSSFSATLSENPNGNGTAARSGGEMVIPSLMKHDPSGPPNEQNEYITNQHVSIFCIHHPDARFGPPTGPVAPSTSAPQCPNNPSSRQLRLHGHQTGHLPWQNGVRILIHFVLLLLTDP